MKNRSQFSLKSFKFTSNHLDIFKKDICLFDLAYLLRILCTSTITTLILITVWQVAEPPQQPPEKLAEKVSGNTITSTPTNNALKLPNNQLEELFKTQLPFTEKLAYNVKAQPPIRPSQDLQKIVDRVVNLAAKKGLPTTSLSVTLIDLKTGKRSFI